MLVIGLMSGTSADGIDAAVAEIAGAPPDLRWRLLAHTTIPHPQALREAILAGCDPRASGVDQLCVLDVALGRAFGHAALAAAQAAGIAPAQIDLVGSHGQTLWHAPQADPPATLQLGRAAEIAELTGAPVVSDFRARDMAAGGQGAPLVAAVDVLLLAHPERARAAQNIGGIANVTYLPPGGAGAFAFDTGPGNMLIDDAVSAISGGRETFDRDGALAASGQIHAAQLAELLSEPFFRAGPPKTTGREDFGAAYGRHARARAAELGVAGADLVATLTALTAHSIAAAYRDFLPHMPDEVIVSGGGARNQALMGMLRGLLSPARLLTIDDLGIPSEAKEALAFAILAYETWHGRPGNLPAATGARRAAVLGSITPGHRPSAIGYRPSPFAERSNAGTASLPLTEARNPRSAAIDALPTEDMVRLINAEDALVAAAVAAEAAPIARAIDAIVGRLSGGGRLVYAGAGTSGRLGALDAAECPPTFSTPPELIVALIAGGPRALTAAIEGAEDDAGAGARDVAALGFTERDALVGIAASGATPYVLGALGEARRRGALTVSLACTSPSPIAQQADIAIAPLPGPEVISGSTRMKAGTAQKLVLNTISTGVMVRLGKTFGNLMVDLQPTNAKLRRRAQRIVAEAAGLSAEDAAALLDSCSGEVKTAIVAALAGATPDEARRRLAESGGVVRLALAM